MEFLFCCPSVTHASIDYRPTPPSEGPCPTEWRNSPGVYESYSTIPPRSANQNHIIPARFK